MSKNKLRLYFNGEKKEPYRLVKKPSAFFNIIDNSYVSKPEYYYESNGYPHYSASQSLTLKKINNLSEIKLLFYNYDESITGVNYIVPNNKSYTKLYYKYDSNAANIELSNIIQYADFTIEKINDVTYEMTIRIEDIINHNNAPSPTATSQLIISFNRVAPSTEERPYSRGSLKFDVEILSSYIEYDESFLKNYSFSRTINSNNELPNFGIFESDGGISIVDKNNYIKERIAANSLNVNLITDIIMNSKQIAKLVGYNARYPYSSKDFSYSFNDYLSFFEQISISDIVFVNGNPNSMVMTATQLYNELVSITKELFECYFEELSSVTKSFLDDITFTDPKIECKNLKEMWTQFLNATMCSMFVNENGAIETQVYHKANESVIYEIGVDKQNQDIELNLINNNIVSLVSGRYLKYNNLLQQLYNTSAEIIDSYGSQTNWFVEALDHDYSDGPFQSDDIEFAVVDLQSYTIGNRLYESLVVEIDLNLVNTLLGNKKQFMITEDVNRVSGSISERRTIKTYYDIVFLNNLETYKNILPSLAENKIYILNTTNYGSYSRKAKFNVVYYTRDTDANLEITTRVATIQFNADIMESVEESLGESLPYKNSFILQESSLITEKSKYQNQYLKDYLINTIKELYKNGKKTISFTTNNYDFVNSSLTSSLSREKGEILKVGDLIKLIGTSDLTFKITKISTSFEGQFTLQINAIEYDISEE